MIDFIVLEPHRHVVAELLTEAQSHPDVVGVLLIGSLGRGNPVPGSDVDLLLLVDDGRRVERPTQHEERRGVWVELHYRDAAWATAQMDRDPEWIYAYVEGRILHDPRGHLAHLVAAAHDRFVAYRTPAGEKARLAFLADRTRDKLEAALTAGDHDRAGTIVGFGASAIVRLLWAAYDRPIIGPTNIWHHLADLRDFPPGMHQQARALLLGDATERVEAAIVICISITTHLRAANNDASPPHR